MGKQGKVFHVLLLQHNVIIFNLRIKVSFKILYIAYIHSNSTKPHHLFHYDPQKVPKNTYSAIKCTETWSPWHH